MSRDRSRPDRKPLIALVDRANRALQTDMVSWAHDAGIEAARYAHNSVLGHLTAGPGLRPVELARRAGMTRQSMGEVVRDLAQMGVVEMVPDPADGRAKLVRFTDEGLAQARAGYAHIVELEDRFVAEFGE